MGKARELLGLFNSYIAHLEAGRLDVPKGDKLERIRWCFLNAVMDFFGNLEL
jgi:hypothetical protein